MQKQKFIGLTKLSLLAVGALSLTPFANAQGPLAPPGPPGPLFKTLQQVEPRTPIESLPFTITQPGSYYLTGNLQGAAGNGITVRANNVTLDLMGFELRGGAGTVDGVNVNVLVTNVTIRNGSVVNWGQMGVDADTAYNSQVIDIRSAHNGTRGIFLRNGGIINGCTAQGNGTEGIRGGTSTTISGCSATFNADGIVVDFGSTVSGCSVSANRDDGIVAGNGCTISGNSCAANTGDGIEAGSDSQIVNNTCDSNGAGAGNGAGIHTTGANNRIEGNSCIGADRGLDLDAAGNFVANNVVVRNTANYDIANGNELNLLLGQIPQGIPWPATVKLAGSLLGVNAQNGITIASDDVTIDLDGHSLIGVAGSLDGIAVSGNRTNIIVRNGAVRRWGSDGIQANTSFNSAFTDLRIANNGANGLQGGNGAVIKCVTSRANGADGITTASGCVISDSAAAENRSDGIVASVGTTVSGCSAYNNNFAGIAASDGSTVVNCTAYSNTNGIVASDGSTVTACTAASNATNGILAGFGSTINGCTVRLNRTGINILDDCNVINNACDGNGAQGILCRGSDNRIDGNKITDSTVALRANPATGNFIVRNTSSNGVGSYDIAIGNDSGQILSLGTGFVATNPWANFAY